MPDLTNHIIIELNGKNKSFIRNMVMKMREFKIKNKSMIIIKFLNNKRKISFMKNKKINLNLKEFCNGLMNIEHIYKIIGMEGVKV